MYYCYILYSKKLNQFYKGQTQNLEERLRRHNGGLEKATSPGTPWILCWSTEKENRSEATKLEMKLKNLSRKRTIAFMIKYEQGIGSPDELLPLLQQLSGC